jgi:mannitol/fructose-specific phosphotransferase system IIA component (Ntr-type)
MKGMKLTEVLTVEMIKIPLSARDKEGVLQELVDLVSAGKPVADKGALLKAIKDREKLMSTGVGKGIAIPHGKTNAVKDLVIALGSTPVGLDFGALDGEPVRLFFFLASPLDVFGPHVRALAKISRLLNQDAVREALLAAKSPQEVFDILRTEEEKEE